MALAVEEIYDAGADDDLFSGLAARIADAVGARSGVLHWRAIGQSRESEISYSGYFSAADMAAYERLPEGADLWCRAVNEPSRRKRLWRMDELVEPQAYERSAIYNDWIRSIGDDTFHCVGGTIDNDRVVLELGLHRGRSQAPFTQEEVARVTQWARPLLLMVKLRHRLFAARETTGEMSSALDSLGTAVVKLSADGRVIYANEIAERLLARADGLSCVNRRLHAATATDQAELDHAIDRAGSAAEPVASAVAVRRPSGSSYACSLMPVFLNGSRTTLLVIPDPELNDRSLKSRLRSIYKLSDAEAHIAVALANGVTIEQIATERETRVDTVRTQFKSVANKMGCSRQNEVAGLVRSLPLLNDVRADPANGGPQSTGLRT